MGFHAQFRFGPGWGEEGDFDLVLESAEGDFGWGGLLWTPLVVYTIGKGKVALCQLALRGFFDTAPQAAWLLQNLLDFGLAFHPKQPAMNALLAGESSAAAQWLQAAGNEIASPKHPPKRGASGSQ